MKDVFKRLTAEGVSVWLDDISRDRLDSGSLARLVETGRVTGVTSNPTIFEQALTSGSAYREQLAGLAGRGVHAEEAVRELTTHDIRWACDELAGVHRRTSGRDGLVSIEVDPRKARDTAATVAEARALWRAVDRPNLLIKIPATVESLPAVAACLAEGIGVNVTLIFSTDRYREVTEVFLDGMERARAAGLDVSRIASVASFFVSRLDTAVDGRLAAVSSPEARAMSGRSAVANARLAYQVYEESLASARWRALAAAGARPQRLLWASTGVKNPDYRDTLYVEELVAPDTVNTMPEATLNAVADHAEIYGDRVRRHYADSRRVLDYLPWFGISYDAVVSSLESAALDAFVGSWEALLETVQRELDAHRLVSAAR
ncbi:transaldolase [Streptomyces sp. NPDC059979]|uniref:transaldolase n=1 Tax=unclassified Streptomyces TaxID=2593676 RepID=UPI003657CCD2